MQKKDEVFSLVLPERLVDETKAVMAEAEPGDAVLFDAQVFHASGSNLAGKDRYSLIFTYQPGTDTSHHRAGLPERIRAAANGGPARFTGRTARAAVDSEYLAQLEAYFGHANESPIEKLQNFPKYVPQKNLISFL